MYLSFLSLFWMTAPLAWLYAIPFERFMTPVGAMRANLTVLGVVAVWRESLMVRVATVLMGSSWPAALFQVMLFADIEALIASFLIPVPLIQVMGGIRLSDTDRLLQALKVNLLVLSVLSLPIWLIGSAVARSKQKSLKMADLHHVESGRSRGLFSLACVSVAVWAVILPFTQPEQRLRSRVEQDFKAGQIADALAELSSHNLSDYPPHWEPPPFWREDDSMVPLLVVLEEIAEQPPAPWVQAVYRERLRRCLDDLFSARKQMGLFFHSENHRHLGRLANVIPKLSYGPSLLREHQESLKQMLANKEFDVESINKLYQISQQD
jgi:hypothetical protein